MDLPIKVQTALRAFQEEYCPQMVEQLSRKQISEEGFKNLKTAHYRAITGIAVGHLAGKVQALNQLYHIDAQIEVPLSEEQLKLVRDVMRGAIDACKREKQSKIDLLKQAVLEGRGYEYEKGVRYELELQYRVSYQVLNGWYQLLRGEGIPSYPYLRACSCKSSELRNVLENKTIERVCSKYPKESPLVVVSVGAGRCLQELAYLVKLEHAGYREIRLIVIDPSPKTPKAVLELDQFAKDCLVGCRVDLIHYNSVEEYKEISRDHPDLRPQLLLLIDLDTENGLLNASLKSLEQELSLLSEEVLVSYTMSHWEEDPDLKSHQMVVNTGNCGFYQPPESGPGEASKIDYVPWVKNIVVSENLMEMIHGERSHVGLKVLA